MLPIFQLYIVVRSSRHLERAERREAEAMEGVVFHDKDTIVIRDPALTAEENREQEEEDDMADFEDDAFVLHDDRRIMGKNNAGIL